MIHTYELGPKMRFIRPEPKSREAVPENVDLRSSSSSTSPITASPPSPQAIKRKSPNESQILSVGVNLPQELKDVLLKVLDKGRELSSNNETSALMAEHLKREIGAMIDMRLKSHAATSSNGVQAGLQARSSMKAAQVQSIKTSDDANKGKQENASARTSTNKQDKIKRPRNRLFNPPRLDQLQPGNHVQAERDTFVGVDKGPAYALAEAADQKPTKDNTVISPNITALAAAINEMDPPPLDDVGERQQLNICTQRNPKVVNKFANQLSSVTKLQRIQLLLSRATRASPKSTEVPLHITTVRSSYNEKRMRSSNKYKQMFQKIEEAKFNAQEDTDFLRSARDETQNKTTNVELILVRRGGKNGSEVQQSPMRTITVGSVQSRGHAVNGIYNSRPGDAPQKTETSEAAGDIGVRYNAAVQKSINVMEEGDSVTRERQHSEKAFVQKKMAGQRNEMIDKLQGSKNARRNNTNNGSDNKPRDTMRDLPECCAIPEGEEVSCLEPDQCPAGVVMRVNNHITPNEQALNQVLPPETVLKKRGEASEQHKSLDNPVRTPVVRQMRWEKFLKYNVAQAKLVKKKRQANKPALFERSVRA